MLAASSVPNQVPKKSAVLHSANAVLNFPQGNGEDPKLVIELTNGLRLEVQRCQRCSDGAHAGGPRRPRQKGGICISFPEGCRASSRTAGPYGAVVWTPLFSGFGPVTCGSGPLNLGKRRSSSQPGRRCWPETVSDPRDRFYILFCVYPQFSPQPVDVHVYLSREHQENRSWNSFSSVLHQ